MLNVTYRPFMLSVIMLNVVMLNVVMLNVVMLNVVTLSVGAPTRTTLQRTNGLAFVTKKKKNYNIGDTMSEGFKRLFSLSLTLWPKIS
jgi:hypothetical protein